MPHTSAHRPAEPQSYQELSHLVSSDATRSVAGGQPQMIRLGRSTLGAAPRRSCRWVLLHAGRPLLAAAGETPLMGLPLAACTAAADWVPRLACCGGLKFRAAQRQLLNLRYHLLCLPSDAAPPHLLMVCRGKSALAADEERRNCLGSGCYTMLFRTGTPRLSTQLVSWRVSRTPSSPS